MTDTAAPDRRSPRARADDSAHGARPLATRWRTLARVSLAALLGALCAVAPVAADQESEALPALFESLRETEDAAEAARLEGLIWQEWFVAPDDDARLLMSRLSGAMEGQDADRALELADRLVETAPGFAEAWNRRATIHYLRGEDDRSVADIRETLAREPRHFGAISGLGLIFLRQGDLEAALEAFEQVLVISPASASARRSVERVRRELGREI